MDFFLDNFLIVIVVKTKSCGYLKTQLVHKNRNFNEPSIFFCLFSFVFCLFGGHSWLSTEWSLLMGLGNHMRCRGPEIACFLFTVLLLLQPHGLAWFPVDVAEACLAITAAHLALPMVFSSSFTLLWFLTQHLSCTPNFTLLSISWELPRKNLNILSLQLTHREIRMLLLQFSSC